MIGIDRYFIEELNYWLVIDLALVYHFVYVSVCGISIQKCLYLLCNLNHNIHINFDLSTQSIVVV